MINGIIENIERRKSSFKDVLSKTEIEEDKHRIKGMLNELDILLNTLNYHLTNCVANEGIESSHSKCLNLVAKELEERSQKLKRVKGRDEIESNEKKLLLSGSIEELDYITKYIENSWHSMLNAPNSQTLQK